MKKFYDGGECFILSSFRIDAVPMVQDIPSKIDHEIGIELAKTICEDACFLSSTGCGQTSIEMLRIAGRTAGSRNEHILTIRTHDSSEQDCAIRQEALSKGILSRLHQEGYITEEMPYDDYRRALSCLNREAVWALKKQDIQDYGVQGTYVSPSVIENVDWKKIYSAMDGSGCSFCIQIIPTLLSERERQVILKNAAKCAQAVDGMIPNLRDSLASTSAERWKYFAREVSRPFADVNAIVMGDVSGAALVTARVRQSVQGSTFQTVSIPKLKEFSVYNQPWVIRNTLQPTEQSCFPKWSSGEVSRIFQLPVQKDYFIGIESNLFSLLPEVDLLPQQLTGTGKKSIELGESVYSAQKIVLPLEQLLLHTAVMGKSGVGKTTLLKTMIRQLHGCNIPILILEPVKREYRDLIAGLSDGTIFTVERPVTPLLINPFYVPRGVPLGEYKSSLLSAFKAAFSLPDPLPALFEKAISEAYIQNGWTDMSKSTDQNITLFDMAEFVRIFKRVILRSEYSNEVKGNMMSGGAFRLQSLIERCPHTFDTLNSTSVEDLLAGCSVLEMGSMEPEQKSLVSALTLISILAYLKTTRESDHRLKNIILIDEAHALLDQGEGSTEEEKALNSTMTQLMINVITEIRAYGVGVIFSDQSPSRVGARMLDNVDNILSFRLSGEEAKALKEHMGEDDELCNVLPGLAAGECILKNQYLRSALPLKMNPAAFRRHNRHVTDEQVVRSQMKYLISHAKDYRPFSLCELIGCENCTLAIREEANMYATQIFAERQGRLKKADEIAAHILGIPRVLSARVKMRDRRSFHKICGCAAVHLLRKCSMENGVVFSRPAIVKLISDMYGQADSGSGGNHHESA